MTHHHITHGRNGPGREHPSSVETRSANNGGPDADGWTFRAPRHSGLLACPYCDGEGFTRCDWCGDEGTIFADEFFNGAEQ